MCTLKLNCDFYIEEAEEHDSLTKIIKENGTLPENIKIPITDSDPEFHGCERKKYIPNFLEE